MMTDTINMTPGDKDWDPDYKTKQCLLAMVGEGTGELLGSILFGYIQDHFSDK
jgi:hypothetical protein